MNILLTIAVIGVIIILFSMAYMAACIGHEEKRDRRK